MTEEHKAALAKPKAKYSEERKKETSERVKEEWADGRRNREKGPMKDDHKAAISAAMKGKPKGEFSKDHKENISKSLLGSKRRLGKKFPGTKWWNNGTINSRKLECPGEGWTLGKIKTEMRA